ncbi:MaoC family dehydratase N-terminal domain-containing protein [Rhodococcus sp. CX]|uniref:MaoC/PaaZ C-terminal domain-containing protein n=1 Tax=Rhodococcus sp. CX TaxID=2789880 RepID=UPI0018CF6543|nr:MaoC/PaaZ C-terminal domain-containing protein [Rhodococcus sp. CX]MBH0119537.1 MaoC family dehydratase N-terminal domain-containing protein [Rhodococcus sp. CX]
MSLDPRAVGASSEPRTITWTARDCMLYALGVGAGTGDLTYTTNNTAGVEQAMLPTMPVTLGVDFSVLKRAGKIDWTRLLHAEQEIELVAPLPVDGTATATTRIAELWDKEKAALVVAETEGVGTDGTPLWRSRASLFLKGAGGWGGDRGPSSNTSTPEGNPDKTISYRTAENQALIYRLSGDYNPLHSDPSFAKKAGMDAPILHGLCTFGFAGRAVLEAVGGDPTRIRSIRARFASPVWPGDDLHVDLWDVDDATVHFRVRGRDDEVVLSGGVARLG